MICEWNELVEYEVFLPFLVIMSRDSYSRTEGVFAFQYLSIDQITFFSNFNLNSESTSEVDQSDNYFQMYVC